MIKVRGVLDLDTLYEGGRLMPAAKDMMLHVRRVRSRGKTPVLDLRDAALGPDSATFFAYMLQQEGEGIGMLCSDDTRKKMKQRGLDKFYKLYQDEEAASAG